MYLKKIFIISIAATLYACDAGTGEGLDQNGIPLEGQETIPLASNFKSIQANIFTPSCATSGCHSGSAPPEGLLLSGNSSFTNLVNIESSQVPSIDRIEPGDADNSYLVNKIEGTASVGQQMPRNLPALSLAKIQSIREWVDNGAIVPTLTSIQNNIFTPRCISCHSGSTPPAQLNLEDGLAYSNLVGVSRPFDPEIRVIAGNASASFLVDKLENNNLGNSRGDQMPLGGPYLDQNTIEAVKNWINAGALNN